MILKFAVVSGSGWLIDFSIFTFLNFIGFPVWLANFLGATTAVIFVFLVSVRNVFRYGGDYILYKLIKYVIYQFVAISVASILIDFIAMQFNTPPLIAKIIVTPLTFYANFLFMGYITLGRVRYK